MQYDTETAGKTLCIHSVQYGYTPSHFVVRVNLFSFARLTRRRVREKGISVAGVLQVAS